MERCIRDKDGNEVSSSVWRAIKKSAKMLVNIYLKTLKDPTDPLAKTKTKGKTYYSRFFPQIWNDVLSKLEQNEPLLRLCAAHWKADHIIGNCLQAIVEENRKNKKKASAQSTHNDASDSEVEGREDIDLEPEVQARGRKRAPEELLEPVEKKKKRPKVKKGTVEPVSTRNGQ